MTDKREKVELINPATLAKPSGYSHGAVGRGRVLAIAGQIGWTQAGVLVSSDFFAQFDRALANVAEVLRAAGGRPEDLISMRIYVTDKKEYWQQTEKIGVAYRTRFGRHFPAMALLEVKDLLEEGAKVEIEAMAVVP